MPITTAAVYCPGQTPAITKTAQGLIAAFEARIHGQPLWGGGRALNQLDADATLYVMAHAWGQLSVFSIEHLDWTADELAALMRDDLLATNHRKITLLTCRAGMSFGTQSMVAMFRALKAALDRAEQRDDKFAVADIKRQFNELAAMRRPAEPYTPGGKQMPPLGCDLARALSGLGYRSLAITSYKFPVASYFNPQAGKEIILQIPQDVLAARSTDYSVVWRTA